MNLHRPAKRGKVVNIYYPNRCWRPPRAAILRPTAAYARRFVEADRQKAGDGEEREPTTVGVGPSASLNHAETAQAESAFVGRTLEADHFGPTRNSTDSDRARDNSIECRMRFKRRQPHEREATKERSHVAAGIGIEVFHG